MDELLYEVRDGVAYVTFNRPQARNALTFAMYERLAEICNGANTDRSIKAILITGAGDKAFAAGTDISQFRSFDKEQDALDYEARIDRVMNAIERRRDPRRLHRRRREHRRVLRPAHRLAHHEVRLPGGAHAGQLPFAAELRAPGVPARAGAGEGHRVPRAPDRGGRSAAHRAHQRAGG